MKSILINILTFLFLASNFYSQTIPPKREFRSVWIASVTNIDWPSNKNLTPSAQRTEYINILNKHKLNGLNAVVTQIRPSCDAFYQSAIEPWSEWLTGTQGVAPNPFYDPLIFTIDETHKRGMEFHAWFNPYRAVLNKNTSSISPTHVSVVHPDWVREYGNLKLLDPGLPQVRNYVASVIMDVVRRYDIDGVHFDDYFYPYPQSGVTFQDSATFANYPNGFTNKDDWRRNNINLLIQMLSDSIKAVKPHVKFGISPFGIWRNQSSDPLGSATAGFESYSGIYADSRKWMQQGWLDYINPQIYWNIGYSVAAYDVLVEWWTNNNFGKHFYTGNAAYKIGSSSPSAWLNPSEMPDQVRFNHTYDEVKGMNFFSSKSITNNLLGIQDSLRNSLFNYPALVPVMPWKDSVPPSTISNLSAFKNTDGVLVTWQKPTNDPAKYFIVYRFDDQTLINIDDPRYFRTITYNDTTSFLDTQPIGLNTQTVTYVVTSLDRLHNETPVSAANSITLQIVVPVELTLFYASVEGNSVNLIWKTASEKNNYGFEIEKSQISSASGGIKSEMWEKIGFLKGSGTTQSPQMYVFSDENIFEAGSYSYRLKQIDFDGSYEYSNIIQVEINKPLKFSLMQNYPNPFNPTTIISWQSPISSRQTLKVYDVLGNEVANLVDEWKDAGYYRMEFDASNLSSGVYFYQLMTQNFLQTRKMQILK